MRKKIFFILAIIWMIVIFIFSGRDGNESSDDSFNVGLIIGKIFVKDFDEYDAERKEEFVESISFYVRKGAHASEYALLAMLLSGVFYDEKRKVTYSLLLSWMGATTYAITDEIHQLFVPGRAGMVIDVCIDSLGALAGILVVFALLKIIFRKKKLENNDYC